MKSPKNFFLVMTILVIAMSIMGTGCKKSTPAPPRQTIYALAVKDVLGVGGTVTFTETSSTQTTVDIVLTGAASGSHPAHIHNGAAIEGGSIAISLNPVDASGKSSTVVTQLDNGAAVNYTQLIAFDGYVNVHNSVLDLNTILAQSDIGGNALTGTTKSYPLSTVGASGITGTALFQQRKNDNTLVNLTLSGTLIGGNTYPAYIRLGSTSSVGTGTLEVTLNPVDGASEKSSTNVRTIAGGTAVTYDNWLQYAGYVDVEASATSSVILCEGNIGSSAH